MGQWWALSGLGDLSLLAGVAAWGGDVWEGRGEVIYMFNLLHVDADIHVHVPSHVRGVDPLRKWPYVGPYQVGPPQPPPW